MNNSNMYSTDEIGSRIVSKLVNKFSKLIGESFDDPIYSKHYKGKHDKFVNHILSLMCLTASNEIMKLHLSGFGKLEDLMKIFLEKLPSGIQMAFHTLTNGINERNNPGGNNKH